MNLKQELTLIRSHNLLITKNLNVFPLWNLKHGGVSVIINAEDNKGLIFQTLSSKI